MSTPVSSNPTRSQIAVAAADALVRLDPASMPSALVGFDGFIDSILHMVDKRQNMSATGYTRFHSITDFAARCASAAGKSTNVEQVLVEDRFGGNGPLMAGALACLGFPTTYIGAVSAFDDPKRVHPVFQSFAARCREVVPLCPPSTTDCLEFNDGKLMFNNTANVQQVTWERIMTSLGLARLRTMVEASRLLGIVNWSLMGGVPGILESLMREVLPKMNGERRLFIDLSDPAKRSDADIASMLRLLREMESIPGLSITLGLNLSESERIDKVVGARAYPSGEMGTQGASIMRAAAALRDALGLNCITIHPREGAGSATASGERAWFEGPFTSTPKLSTGAGDHYNGGFAFAQVLGLPLDQCLAIGCAVSGAYVRDAVSPTRERLIEFLRALPEPDRS